MDFLENQSIQVWAAPIIMPIIVGLGGYIINSFRKERQAQKYIDTYSAT